MCKITVTKCVVCQEFIDSVVKECHDRGQVLIDKVPVERCGKEGTVDGYAISGPHSLVVRKVIGQHQGQNISMHRAEILTSLCFWCRESFNTLSKEDREETLADAEGQCGNILWPIFKTFDLPPVEVHGGYLLKIAAHEIERVKPKDTEGFYYAKFSQEMYDERMAFLEGRHKLRKIDRVGQEAVREKDFPFDESKLKDCSTKMILRDHQEFQRNCYPLSWVLAGRGATLASPSSSSVSTAPPSNGSAQRQQPPPGFAAPPAPLAFQPQLQPQLRVPGILPAFAPEAFPPQSRPGHRNPGVSPPAPWANKPKKQRKAPAAFALPVGRKEPYSKTSPRKTGGATQPGSELQPALQLADLVREQRERDFDAMTGLNQDIMAPAQQLVTPPNSQELKLLPSFDMGNPAFGQYGMAQGAMSPVPGSAFVSPVMANAPLAPTMGTNMPFQIDPDLMQGDLSFLPVGGAPQQTAPSTTFNVPPQTPGLNMVNGQPTPPDSTNTNIDTEMAGAGIGFDEANWGPIVDPVLISLDDVWVPDNFGLFDVNTNNGGYAPVAALAAPNEPSAEEMQARLEAAEQHSRNLDAEHDRLRENRLQMEAAQEEVLNQQLDMEQLFDFNAASAPEVDLRNPMTKLLA